jgi:hypothetical protein
MATKPDEVPTSFFMDQLEAIGLILGQEVDRDTLEWFQAIGRISLLFSYQGFKKKNRGRGRGRGS